MRKSVLALLTGLVIAGCTVPRQGAIISDTDGPERLLRHVVLVNFRDDASAEDINRVVTAFRLLPVRITAVHGFEWGTNVSPENINRGYTHCFFLTFTSERNRDTYLDHPAHKEFGEILGPQLEEVLVVDYWAEN